MEKAPAIDVLRALLEQQLRALVRSEEGVRDGGDAEDLHRFRVASRRSRALIRASRPLVRDRLASLDRELRWLGAATGPTRDLDVLIAHLRMLVADLDPDQAGGEAIVAVLERERLQQRRELVRTIDSERYRDLVARFEHTLPLLVPADAEVKLARCAEKELKRLRRAYYDLGDEPADEELHALRIKAKHARYAAELAASGGSRPLDTLADALEELQDLAGAHQDAVVAERRVRGLADEDSCLAAGRIVELERARRREARAVLPAAWKRIERAAEKAF